MENEYFQEALHSFTVDFGYGGAIRHLVDRGYDTDKIIREFHYPLSRETIDRIVQEHRKKLENREDKENREN